MGGDGISSGWDGAEVQLAPVFWGCGVTTWSEVEMGHAPGQMLVLDSKTRF